MRASKRIYFLVLLTLTLPLYSGCSVNPVTGKKEFTLLSVQDEIKMGEENYPSTTQMNNGEYVSTGLKAYINRIGHKLAKVSHRPDMPYEFNVVNSSDINAYALPGGKISITRGLLTAVDNEAELAGVLAHEIGHVTARHAAQAVTRGMILQTALAVGQAAMEIKNVKHRGIYSMAGNLSASLIGLKYSRGQEAQADELGLTYMIRAGYHPAEFTKMLYILKGIQKREPYRIEGLLQNHPLTRDRIKYSEEWNIKTRKEHPNMDKTLRRNSPEFTRRVKPLKDEKEAYNHYDTAERLVAKKKYRESIPEYQKAIQMKRKEGLFHTDLAFAYAKSNQPGKAEAELDKGIYYSPNLFKGRVFAGKFFMKRKNYTRALSELRAAESILPHATSVHYLKGRALEGMRRLNGAAREYQKVIHADPQGPYGQAAQKRLEQL